MMSNNFQKEIMPSEIRRVKRMRIGHYNANLNSFSAFICMNILCHDNSAFRAYLMGHMEFFFCYRCLKESLWHLLLWVESVRWKFKLFKVVKILKFLNFLFL